MVLTRDFRETIQVRAQKDPAFRGDLDTAKAILRDYINARITF